MRFAYLFPLSLISATPLLVTQYVEQVEIATFTVYEIVTSTLSADADAQTTSFIPTTLQVQTRETDLSSSVATTSVANDQPSATSTEASEVTTSPADTITSTPTTTSTPITTSTPSITSTTSTSSTSAETFTGQGTFYNVGSSVTDQSATGTGACGTTLTNSDFKAAISYKMFDSAPYYTLNPNNNGLCGKQIMVYYGTKSVQVTLEDRCAGCEGEYDIDLLPAAFDQIANESLGRIDITWEFI